MKTLYDEKNRLLFVSFEGEIDHHTSTALAKLSDDAIQKYRPDNIIFDFKQVSFMDSSGIGMLLGRYKKLIRFGAHAGVQNISDDLDKIFKMSGIFKIMPKMEEEFVNE